ncbi:HlyD family secretion protein [Tannerella sp.]|uniref:HlyD family secretion protein n=1 Tax=Tannerella sp. TaxID=2382127 RepID=UPI0026DD54FC|nr:HlyD family efflux transporter periplasmic adaptor subunit [Tannerella sp.]MDO4704418.1 HlyD family efflux transporter periplasmic adaptor subunit [Tannerella sp.]
MQRKRLIIIAIALIVVACGNKDEDYDASGVFEATEVLISAKETGELLSLTAREGEDVKAHEPLGRIDTTRLYLQKLQLTAGLTAIESRRHDIPRQIASLRQQIATQKKEYERYASLVEAQAAAPKTLDDIDAHIAVLEKQLAAQKDALTNGNRSIEGESMGLRAQIAQIDDRIGKSFVSSPIDGTVLTRYAEPGELAVQGRPLLKVGDLENMILRVYITADQLTLLRIGQKVSVYVDRGASERKKYTGTINWISDKAEFTPKTIRTRDERANLVYAVKVAVRNDGAIKRGMYGEIRIDTDERGDAPIKTGL